MARLTFEIAAFVALILVAVLLDHALAEPSGPMPPDWSIAEAIENAPVKLEQAQ